MPAKTTGNGGKSRKSSAGGRSSQSKNSINTVKTVYRRSGMSVGQFFACVILLLVGVISGIGCMKLVTEGDRFELLGEKEIHVGIGEEFFYTDEGVKLVSLGRDLSDSVKVETNLKKTDKGYTVDSSRGGVYYIKYTVDDIKYGETVRVRAVIVGEGEK